MRRFAVPVLSRLLFRNRGRNRVPRPEALVKKRTLLVLPIAALLGLTACSSGGSGNAGADGSGSAATSSSGGALSGTLTVFAAASLTDVFTELGKQLEEQNPDLKVQFNFAGSSALATQLTQGAPADVFASANTAQMKVVTDAGLQSAEPEIFTENVLEIAVPKGNPGHVTGIKDFGNPDLTLAVCAPTVPCGAAAEQVFQAAGVDAKPDTQEEDVKAAGSDVEGIPFPEAEEAINQYPIVALKAAPNPDAAQAFVDLVTSDVGQRALQEAGFRAPTH